MWVTTVICLLVSPLIATPTVFLLMLGCGDLLFGADANADPGMQGLVILALQRTIAGVYITLIIVADQLLILGTLLVAVSYLCARFVLRPGREGRRLVFVILLYGTYYPFVWILAEVLNWNSVLFN